VPYGVLLVQPNGPMRAFAKINHLEATQMKFPVAVFVTFVALVLPLKASAQADHLAHHDSASANKPEAAMINGVVRRVDKAAGSVTIAHEALTNLNMPKMTMTFLVKDRSWLDRLKEGGKIRFIAENVNGELTVVALQASK
jgi:Cu(I)/Ag(I) efflux system protein CusF